MEDEAAAASYLAARSSQQQAAQRLLVERTPHAAERYLAAARHAGTAWTRMMPEAREVSPRSANPSRRA